MIQAWILSVVIGFGLAPSAVAATDPAVVAVQHTYEARIRFLGKVSTTQVKASDAGQAKKLVQQQFPKATVLSVKRVDEGRFGKITSKRATRSSRIIGTGSSRKQDLAELRLAIGAGFRPFAQSSLRGRRLGHVRPVHLLENVRARQACRDGIAKEHVQAVAPRVRRGNQIAHGMRLDPLGCFLQCQAQP